MSATPEVLAPTQPEVQTAPEAPAEIPQAVEQTVSTTPAPAQQQVVQQAPAQPVQPQQAPVVSSNVPTITVPTSQVQLQTMAQGDAGSSVTWLAHFWERIIKKALKKGWHVVFGGEPVAVPAEVSSESVQQKPPETVQ